MENLPDVALQKINLHGKTLTWVGMKDIQAHIYLKNGIQAPAVVSAFVNLINPQVRGIHMSRLFQAVQDHFAGRDFNFEILEKIGKQMIDSHAGLSDQSKLNVQFQWPLQQKSLVSDLSAARNYPVEFSVVKASSESSFRFKVEVLYSSTCPASAALSQQLIQSRFKQEFGNQDLVGSEKIIKWLGEASSLAGTPHAQRSIAELEFEVTDINAFKAEEIIQKIEMTLKTPVQSFVKREDEQEFARLNAENLMFCEDAARRLKSEFEIHPVVQIVSGCVRHIESLHPHEAVAYF